MTQLTSFRICHYDKVSLSPWGLLQRLQQGDYEFDHRPLYPTFAADVACLLMLLLENLSKGEELRGIYHWQGPSKIYEFQMAELFSQALGLKVPLRKRNVLQVRDRALDISRLSRSCPLRSTPFSEGVRTCLSPGSSDPAPVYSCPSPGTLQWGRAMEQHVWFWRSLLHQRSAKLKAWQVLTKLRKLNLAAFSS